MQTPGSSLKGKDKMFNNPSVSDFKTQFTRDFPYGTDPNTSVLDSDITSAFTYTNVNINQGLFLIKGLILWLIIYFLHIT